MKFVIGYKNVLELDVINKQYRYHKIVTFKINQKFFFCKFNYECNDSEFSVNSKHSVIENDSIPTITQLNYQVKHTRIRISKETLITLYRAIIIYNFSVNR